MNKRVFILGFTFYYFKPLRLFFPSHPTNNKLAHLTEAQSPPVPILAEETEKKDSFTILIK